MAAKKIYFETYGCAMNTSDSETMKGILTTEGFKIVSEKDKANVIIINSCIVKAPTLQKIVRRAKLYKKEGKVVIVSGCIPQAEPEELKDFSLVGTEGLIEIANVVNETLDGNIVKLLKRTNDKRLNLPKIRRNDIIEIVPISRGCLGNCAYCKVKSARGNLVSYEPKEILKQIRKSVKEGVKEIWLTSQDNGCYGHDIGTNIIELIKQILTIKGDYKLRIGMANPNFVRKYLNGFIEIFEDPRVFRFIHIPLQAGSDNVLKDMKRQYSSKDFIKICKTLRDKFLDITLATDIICGFPTETDDDFMETLKVCEKTQLDVINISKYYNMPGTASSKLKQLDTKIISARSKLMTELFHRLSLKRNNECVGWEDIVLIDEIGKDGSMLGRNYAYKPVLVKGKKLKIGDTVKVTIKRATKFNLYAEVIEKIKELKH